MSNQNYLDQIDYVSEPDVPDSESVFKEFLDETNAQLNGMNFRYVITEEEGNVYVDELSYLDGFLSCRRALITDEYIIEGRLRDDLVKEIEEKYEELV